MISEVLANVGREITVQEPVLTWNLFWTTLIVPICSGITVAIIVNYVNRKHKERDEKDKNILELMRTIEEQKQQVTLQWRENHSAILCRVKENVENIYSSLDKKVDKDDCDRLRRTSYKGHEVNGI